MAFVDEVRIAAQAGKGGDGVVRWRREKFVPKGGPAGGDGGKGGDVYLEGVADLGVLARYRAHPHFRAGDGAPGGSNKKRGADGSDIVIEVPVGSVVVDETRGITYEVLRVGQRIKVLHGGEGGKGNAAFVSSVNQAPTQATKGVEGEYGMFHITLKLIADAGFVGLPNAGKSTLLNALTNAHSRVGNYPFTTLEPYLGAMRCPQGDRSFILADLPGIIEGAEAGRGLGHKFLRHIERTRVLLHTISPIRDSIEKQYKIVKRTLASYHLALAQRPEILVLTHRDEVSDEEAERLRLEAERVSGLPSDRIYFVSVLFPETIEHLRSGLCAFLLHLSSRGSRGNGPRDEAG